MPRPWGKPRLILLQVKMANEKRVVRNPQNRAAPSAGSFHISSGHFSITFCSVLAQHGTGTSGLIGHPWFISAIRKTCSIRILLIVAGPREG